MKKPLVLLVMALLLGGCEEESFLRLQNSRTISELVPDFTAERQYRTGTDTIALRKISESTYYEEAPGTDVGSSLGSFDQLKLQRRTLVVGSDTPYFRISFEVQTFHESSAATQSRDVLRAQLDEDNFTNSANLEVEYRNSLQCLSATCAFTDTLVLDSVNYYNVYYLAADSAAPSLFINSAQGLVGFRTSENLIYQRIN